MKSSKDRRIWDKMKLYKNIGKIHFMKETQVQKIIIISFFLLNNVSLLLIFNANQLTHIGNTYSTRHSIDEVFHCNNLPFEFYDPDQLVLNMDQKLVHNTEILPYFDIEQIEAQFNSTIISERNLRIVCLPQNFATFYEIHPDFFVLANEEQEMEDKVVGIYIDYLGSNFQQPEPENSTLSLMTIQNSTISVQLHNVLYLQNSTLLLDSILYSDWQNFESNSSQNSINKNHSLLLLSLNDFRDVYEKTNYSNIEAYITVKLDQTNITLNDWKELDYFFRKPSIIVSNREIQLKSSWLEGITAKDSTEYQMITIKNILTLLLFLIWSLYMYTTILKDFFYYQYDNNQKNLKILLTFGENFGNPRTTSRVLLKEEIKSSSLLFLINYILSLTFLLVKFNFNLLTLEWFFNKLTWIFLMFFTIFMISNQLNFNSLLKFNFSEKSFKIKEEILPTFRFIRTIIFSVVLFFLFLLVLYIHNRESDLVSTNPIIFFFIQLFLPVLLCLLTVLLLFELTQNIFHKNLEKMGIISSAKLFLSSNTFRNLVNAFVLRSKSIIHPYKSEMKFSFITTFSLLQWWIFNHFFQDFHLDSLESLNTIIDFNPIKKYILPLQSIGIFMLLFSQLEHYQKNKQIYTKEIEKHLVYMGNTNEKITRFSISIRIINILISGLYYIVISLLASILVFYIYLNLLFSILL